MRQVVLIVLTSATLVLATGTSLAKEKSTLDLAPLLDGFVEGCNFSEPLYELIASLRDTTRSGGTLALPDAYVAVAGEPTHEADDAGNQQYYLPLAGQWHGQAVAGLDFVNQDDAGMYVAAVRFAGEEGAVSAQFQPLVDESLSILVQDEMAADFEHFVMLNTDQGVTRLVCNLST